MPTNPNMVAIQTVTVGAGGAASIDFTNIPQTYTDLVVRASLRSDRATLSADTVVKFNGSSASYSSRYILGTGASAISATDTATYLGQANGSTSTASTFNNAELYIPNYTSSSNKSSSADVVMENNATTGYTFLGANLWSNTAAITSISLTPISNSWAQYSTATLYGVTSAGYGAKATGGIITQDANYYYHTFLASGTFTPTQSLSCDVLVVAGGGGGGLQYGGGGGAGGLCYQTGRSLSATGYTVTIGAGGNGATNAAGAVGSTGSNSVFDTITSNGGGGGGGFSAATTGGNGGSGGGGGAGATNPSTSTAGTATQGNSGGATGYGNNGGIGRRNGNVSGGGGGGSGAAGTGAPDNGGSSNGGAGGIGLNTWSSWLTVTGTGVSGYIAAGGGGGSSGTRGTGGTGGGGDGGSSGGVNSTNAVANTGSGGGGGYEGSGTSNGANGGSGIVIVRYAK